MSDAQVNLGVVKIVEKPWGREIWVAHTDKYALKIIEIRKGHRSSLQYHRRKHEHLFVDQGRLQVEWEDEEGKMQSFILGVGDVIENKPGRKHRSTPLEDVRLIEVSTPELDDVVRLSDDYGRIEAS
jgi:mannose-6-phosphate isomerase-like protein (cupin superfamily)